MIITQTTITATLYSFDLEADNGNATVDVEKYDGTTWNNVDSLSINNGNTEVYDFSVDGLYRFKFTETGTVGTQYYLAGIDLAVRNCLKLVSAKVINEDDETNIKNYNSLNLSILTLYNLLPASYREVIFTDFSTNIPVTSLQDYLVVFDRVVNYCDTITTEEDCECS